MLAQLGQKLESISEKTGQLISWLTLLIVLVTFLVVVLRYVFDFGSIALQESVSYLHAFVFMLGAAYTLKHDAHVRVDIFYRKMSAQNKALVDIFGTALLLIPVCLFIIYSSWNYVLTSWSLGEESGEAGGLAYVFLLKTTLLIMPALLIIQGLANIFQNLLNLKTKEEH